MIVCGSRDTDMGTGAVVQDAAFCCSARSRPCLCGFFGQAEHNDEFCRGSETWPRVCHCVIVCGSRDTDIQTRGAVVQDAAFCCLTRTRLCLCGFFSQAESNDESCRGSETWPRVCHCVIVCGSRDTGMETRGAVVRNAVFCRLTRSRSCLCGFFGQAEPNGEFCRGSETWHHGFAIVCGSRDTGIQTRGTVVQNAAFCCLTRSWPCLAASLARLSLMASPVVVW